MKLMTSMGDMSGAVYIIALPMNENRLLSRADARAVDRDAIARLGIPGIVLMENAARGAADAIEQRFDIGGANVIIVCGTGNNGGDGYALARHLWIRGAAVRIAALGDPGVGSDAATNANIARKMGIPIEPWSAEYCHDADMLIDAIFGTGLDRNIEEPVRGIVQEMNAATVPRVAVDIPSGLDCDDGAILGIALRASLTVTFVGWKRGFAAEEARPCLGEVVVVDIGCPAN
ncbi:MAG: NAD(P)H-hydrate epimerase [Phycisphaerales bacterium]|jgi:NAD(P)H-hydrate epimerase|nr:NAD(P)H-hydrate epimerase [Phycisphaerales bacterium]